MRRETKEILLRVIDLCETVRKRGLDPFDVEVQEFFDKLREILPRLKRREDLYLDIQALLSLADVIHQQEEWVKHRSSMLYLDPLLIALKLQAMPARDLAEIFVRSWHPIVELESIAPPGISEAKRYWTDLPPLKERHGELKSTEVGSEEIDSQELSRMGILSTEEFENLMHKTWEELWKAVGEDEEVPYWDFISAPTFEETVRRAWLVSFLVSYGYAGIELRPLEDEIILIPSSMPQRRKEATVSIPISITKTEWLERREHGRERHRGSEGEVS